MRKARGTDGSRRGAESVSSPVRYNREPAHGEVASVSLVRRNFQRLARRARSSSDAVPSSIRDRAERGTMPTQGKRCGLTPYAGRERFVARLNLLIQRGTRAIFGLKQLQSDQQRIATPPRSMSPPAASGIVGMAYAYSNSVRTQVFSARPSAPRAAYIVTSPWSL